MANIICPEDLLIIKQPEKKLYMKAELLNKNFKTVGQVAGQIIQDDYSVDADSENRRTYNVTFVAEDGTFEVGQGKKIWLDKYIRLSVGFYYLREDYIRWYSMGIYNFNNANYFFNASSRQLTISCYDRSVELTGERNGILSGLGTSIPTQILDGNGIFVDNTIRNAMIKTVVELGGIKRYRIEKIDGKIETEAGFESTDKVPYDLNFGTGSTVWDIVKELRDLYVGYETFFDGDVFVCQPIPTYESDPIILDANVLDELIIEVNYDYDFTKVKNVTEVWGKCIDAQYFASSANMRGTTCYLYFNDDATYEITNGTNIGFKSSGDNIDGCLLSIPNVGTYPILVDENRPIGKDKIKAGNSYVVKFVQGDSQSFFLFLGQYQICGIVKLVSKEPNDAKKQFDLVNEPTNNIFYVIDPDSPFCSDIEGIGEIRQLFSSGEFENITSDELAIQRAKFENWISTDLLENITISMLDVPWLDVNKKIELTSYAETNKDGTGKKIVYLTKSKSGSSIKGVMSVTAVRFKPQYPWNS